MSKSKTKSNLNKAKFVYHEQRIRLVDRVRNINYRKPFTYTKKVPGFVRGRPFLAFFITLFLLALLILLGSTVFKAKPLEEHKGEIVKQVETFKIGSSPKISVQAEVEKTGVIKIVAQSGGIVSSVNTYEGESVARGKSLVSLASNYYGGNSASVGRQIAQQQYNLSKDTVDLKKEIIQKERQQAEKTDAGSDEQRDITNRSLEETRSLLDMNEAMLTTSKQNLPPTNDLGYAAANSAMVGLQAGVNQLRQSVRGLELNAASDRPTAELSNIKRELSLKNLEVEEKSLLIGHEIAKLQLFLAQVTEAAMYPTTPFEGVVEKVHVRVGESVSPGTTLVTITGVEGKIILDAKVPAIIAKNLSKLETSTISMKGQTIEVMPAYISSEATNGQLYSVIYHIPDEYQEFFTNDSYVSLSIPVGAPDTNSVVPFIPLDAIFQTQEESTVYVVVGDKAEARKIQLGEVQGGFVAVMQGIGAEDQIILSRNVVEGDKVRTQE